MIELEGVGRVFGEGAGRTVALHDVSLHLAPGRFMAVAGPSGSGKTTLLNLIGVIDDPTTGSVTIDGRRVAGMSDAERADLRLHRVGFIFQHFNLVPVLTARENVELPLLFHRGLGTTIRRARAARALERVGLSGRWDARPAQLSGGERQRVAVARALAGEPSLVLADEPTASLDQETGRSVIELMRALNREKGTTFLYATHDPELIAMADGIVLLRDGRVVEGPEATAGAGRRAGSA